MENRPQGREKNVTGHGNGIGRRGNGLGTGPVGNAGGYSGRTPRRGGSGGPTRGGGSGGGLLKIGLLLALLLGGGAGVTNFSGGGSEQAYPVNTQPAYSQSAPAPQQTTSNPYGSLFGSGMGQGFDYSSLFGGGSSNSGHTASSGWIGGNNTGVLNLEVAPTSRDRYTRILGNNQDTATIMLYMCGTDLESQSAMASKDLQEMVNASLNDHINLIIYTGGCRQWRNSIVSSSVNQIYKVEKGGLICLNKNAGNGAMTSPKTLSSFIQFCSKNYPASRNMLILWDHGGGSISGYGYDEKTRGAGSMTLKGLDEALAAGKTKFDFIGFDACLMATLENGLTMAPYADYLIASEETEPGLGWYYTNWLTTLAREPSISTPELGKKIADDFVSACAQSCPGQKTTLSVVDLAELETTIPSAFNSFSASTLEMLKNDGYQTVSNARSSTREFAASTKIDQIDLVHLALKLDTRESRKLADTILSAVKYNRTSSDMTNAYGLSLYFPYKKVSNVNNAVAAYNAIGLDDAYTDCIRTFASLEISGQAAAGTSHTSPIPSLSGQSSYGSGQSSYGGGMVGSDLLTQMLAQMLGGNTSAYGFTNGSTSFFDRSLDLESTADYLAENRFDQDALIWQSDADGYSLHMSEKQWSLVQDLELNVFVDDGQGYIDLGLDNTFDFTENGDLVGAYDGTWLAIDNQNVAYYHIDTTLDEDSYTITGRVPVLLNGTRAELILVFTSQQPYGYIAGARTDYRNGETETVAKGITELTPGDTIDYLCDYYTYDGAYEDSYMLGEQHIYTGREQISNVYLDAPVEATYRITDLYNNSYWTPVIP